MHNNLSSKFTHKYKEYGQLKNINMMLFKAKTARKLSTKPVGWHGIMQKTEQYFSKQSYIVLSLSGSNNYLLATVLETGHNME